MTNAVALPNLGEHVTTAGETNEKTPEYAAGAYRAGRAESRIDFVDLGVSPLDKSLVPVDRGNPKDVAP